MDTHGQQVGYLPPRILVRPLLNGTSHLFCIAPASLHCTPISELRLITILHISIEFR
jgi:hypothetical protein